MCDDIRKDAVVVSSSAAYLAALPTTKIVKSPDSEQGGTDDNECPALVQVSKGISSLFSM